MVRHRLGPDRLNSPTHSKSSTSKSDSDSKGQEKPEKGKREYFIGADKHISEYMRDNEYITHGYRIGFTSVKRVLRSLFMCHNETANVLSHLVGVLIFVALIFYTFNCLGPVYLADTHKAVLASLNLETENNNPYNDFIVKDEGVCFPSDITKNLENEWNIHIGHQ